MTTTSKSKRPTHRVYAVSKRGEDNFWREIGAAWQHDDGDGFSLKLDMLPIDGSSIVVRKPKADDKAGAQ